MKAITPSFACLGLAASVLATLLCVAARAGEPGGDKEAEQGIKAGDRDPEFILRVNTAVGKGIEWLESQQSQDGAFKGYYDTNDHGGNGPFPGGTTALALLALLKSGVPSQDEHVEKGFAFLRAQPINKVYTAGTTLMALEARWRHQKVEDRIRGQTLAAQPAQPKIQPRDLDWMKELVGFLLGNMTDSKNAPGLKDVWTYPPEAGGDHSNTQYALLGLRAAQNCGVAVPRSAWEDIWGLMIDHFLDRQERDGPKVPRVKLLEDKEHGYATYKTVTGTPDTARGWTYISRVVASAEGQGRMEATTGSMTTVGVASLIIATDCLASLNSAKLTPARRAGVTKAVNDGLAWLTLNFSVEENPRNPDSAWVYYYLYGLERACVLSGVRNLGRHDWYREGAEWLMKNQNGDGSWTAKAVEGTHAAACFALLFLTKATMPGKIQITR